MALYLYQAYAKDGKKLRGTIDSSSVVAAREQLVAMGMYPITIELAADTSAAIPWYKRLFIKKVSLKDKIVFTRQLAVLLRSGIPLLQALDLLSEQFEGQMHSILVEIKDGIKEGKSFADGLARYPKIFDNIYVQLVRAGEATGNLEIILDRLTDYMEQRAKTIKKIKAALRYPMIQLGVVILVTIVLLTAVVPQIADAFIKQGKELPTATKIVMAISNFLLHYYWLFLIIIIAFIAGYIYFSRTPIGARFIDKVKLKIPVIGYFARMGAVIQFCRTLGMLIEGGVNLPEALDIVVNIIDNRILSDALDKARDKIIKQGKMAEYLKQTNIFPSIAIYLISTGEQSGKLDSMLLTVAHNYEEDVSEFSENLTAVLEPIMMVFMAVIVGTIILSIAQPMMQSADLFS